MLALASAEWNASDQKLPVLKVVACFPQERGSAILRAARLPDQKAKAREEARLAAERLKAIGKPGLAKELLEQAGTTWA